MAIWKVTSGELLTNPSNEKKNYCLKKIHTYLRYFQHSHRRNWSTCHTMKLVIFYSRIKKVSMLGGSLVTTAWHVLRLWMEEPASCYGWSSCLGAGHEAINPSPQKNNLVMKCSKEPQTRADSLHKQAKRQNMDMRFGTWKVRICTGRAP
jgi:hypothetical protein